LAVFDQASISLTNHLKIEAMSLIALSKNPTSELANGTELSGCV